MIYITRQGDMSKLLVLPSIIRHLGFIICYYITTSYCPGFVISTMPPSCDVNYIEVEQHEISAQNINLRMSTIYNETYDGVKDEMGSIFHTTRLSICKCHSFLCLPFPLVSSSCLTPDPLSHTSMLVPTTYHPTNVSFRTFW